MKEKLGMDVRFGGSGGGGNVQESRCQRLIRSLSYTIKWVWAGPMCKQTTQLSASTSKLKTYYGADNV